MGLSTITRCFAVSAALVALLIPAARGSADAPSPAASARRATPPANDPESGLELIGTPAPSWSFDRWVRGGPLTLQDLRGKVILLRWWTDGCHFCRTTLPVIDKLRREHPQELAVIGVYHPKPPRAIGNGQVLRFARQLGFGGPIALDARWSTLERYWLAANAERSWTSVSFLVDRNGRIAWVHGGGEYHPSSDPRHARCDAEYRGLEQALAKALAQPMSSVTAAPAER